MASHDMMTANQQANAHVIYRGLFGEYVAITKLVRGSLFGMSKEAYREHYRGLCKPFPCLTY